MTVGQLFDRTGPYSAKGLSGKGGKKKKDKLKTQPKSEPKPQSKPKPSKPKPKDPPKKPKKDKPDKPKKMSAGEKWQHVGKALKETGKQLSETESSERSKTQALKDQLYIRRRGKSGKT